MILNCDRHLSHFTLDFNNGEIVCKSIIFSNNQLIFFNDELFESVVNVHLQRYGFDVSSFYKIDFF